MRHRPFGIAAPRQGSPSRRFAPHRGEAFASSRARAWGFSSRARAWGSFVISRPSPLALADRAPLRVSLKLETKPLQQPRPVRQSLRSLLRDELTRLVSTG